MTTYNANLPADDSYISDGPGMIRNNSESLRTGQIVDAGTVKGLIPGNASGNVPVNNGTVCVNLNADKLQGNAASAFATAAHTHTAVTTSANGFMSNTDKAKLDGVAANAEVNQPAFSNVLVGGTTIQADAKTDTLELVPGTNIAITPDATNDRVTIGITGAIPIVNGGTGNTSGLAATATKLATARTVQTNLASAAAVSFDGSANVTPGVTGTLPIANGGTGAATAANVLTNLGITATTAELNVLDGIMASVTELNYTHGVTSNIQTQLNAKASLASPALTGTPTAPTAAAETSTIQIATCEFVQSAVSNNVKFSDFINFKAKQIFNNQITMSADNNPFTNSGNINLTINTANVGANGRDTTITTNIWYYHYIINGSAGTAGLLSASDTAPILPSGYTKFVRTGAIFNKQLAGLMQVSQIGRDAQYIVANGVTLPVISSGAKGTYSITAPTWEQISIVNFFPPMAAKAKIMLHNTYQGGSGSSDLAFAPTTNYAGYSDTSGNTCWVRLSNVSGYVWPVEFVPEDTTIALACGSKGAVLAVGWTDNL